MLKKIAALVLAGAMVIGSVVPAFADGATPAADNGGPYKITIQNGTAASGATIKGETYTAYKLFDLRYVQQGQDITAADGTQAATTENSSDNTAHAYTLDKDSPFFVNAQLKTSSNPDGKLEYDAATKMYKSTNYDNDGKPLDYTAAILKYFDLYDASGSDEFVQVVIKKEQKTNESGQPLYYTIDTDGTTRIETTVVTDYPVYKENDDVFTAEKAYELSEILKNLGFDTDSAFTDGVWKASNTLIPDEAPYNTPGTESLEIDVSALGAGYYLVTGKGHAINEDGTKGDAVTAAVALTSTDPTAKIVAKLDATTLDKKIDEQQTDATGDRATSEETVSFSNPNHVYDLDNPVTDVAENDVNYDEHSIGETVPYILKTKVPNMTGYEKFFFIVNDTLSKGLKLNDFSDATKWGDDTGSDSGFVVKFVHKTDSTTHPDIVLTRVADEDAADALDKTTTTDGVTTTTYGKAYYVKKTGTAADGFTPLGTTEDKDGFEIVFHHFLQYRGDKITEDAFDITSTTTDGNTTTTYTYKDGYYKDAQGLGISGITADMIGTYTQPYKDYDIVIMYSATLTNDAAIGELGNPNTSKLIFSNNPDLDYDGKKDDNDYPTPYESTNDVVGESEESKTITYVTGLQTFKFYELVDSEKKALAEAEFTLKGENVKSIKEVTEKVYLEAKEEAGKENYNDASHYLLKDGTYTTTDPTFDTYEVVNKKDKDGKDLYFDANGNIVAEGTTGATTQQAVDANGTPLYNVTYGTFRLYEEWNETDKTFNGNALTPNATVTAAVGKDVYTGTNSDLTAAKKYIETTTTTTTSAIYVKDATGDTYRKLTGEYVDKDTYEADTTPNKAAGYETEGGALVTYKALDSTKNWENMTQAEKDAATVTITAKTDEYGYLTFTGLSAGIYTLTESKAPDGFNILPNPIQIKIDWSTTNNQTGKNVADTDRCSWDAWYRVGTNDNTAWIPLPLGDTQANAWLFPFEIENKTGVELPSTGGIGTTIFYAGGAILVLLAGVLLVSKRRYA